ncbi:MAG: hypothetical protein ACHQIG_08395, partial [Acidimicrobiia bacterium]
DKVRRDRKLALLAVAISEYEREFGRITSEEIAAQQRADRNDAVVVRGPRRRTNRKARSA